MPAILSTTGEKRRGRGETAEKGEGMGKGEKTGKGREGGL
jgi:hypothetical protein